MGYRERLLGGQAAVTLLVIVAAVLACAALGSVSTRSSDAYASTLDDLQMLGSVRLRCEELTKATRLYLVERNDTQRATIAELQRQLEPALEHVAARASELQVPEAWRIPQDADAFVGWLSRAAAQGMSDDAFDRELEARRSRLVTDLWAFDATARSRGEERLARARALAHKAQLGIVVTAAIAIALGFVLAVSLLRKVLADQRRLRVAVNLAKRDVAERKELAEVVAHDLRFPLNAVALSASLLRNARDTERSHVDRIAAAAERMEYLLDDLGEVTRFDSIGIAVHKERFDARALIATCIEMFGARAKEQDVRLKGESRDILTVHADRERLIQIFGNLMRDALRSTPRGGVITITAEPHPSGVRFAVSDTGRGIAPEDLPYAFDRDWRGTGRRRTDGAGLGLYICKRLTEAHAGHIGVDSVPGEGSTFWFVIPG